MCGILGLVSPTITPCDKMLYLLRTMGRWQFHRGPDDWGEWVSNGVALGHNRLAILDPKLGKQPMASQDESVQVLSNGEIYNFKFLWEELVRKGHRFRTSNSDTEVIVNGYLEWGVDVFQRLEGMFAIAIWDARKQRLLLARDRLGIKPLYFTEISNWGVVFASEPKTLLASGLIEPRLRREGLVEYFTFRAALHPNTLFDGIRKVPPGCWYAYDLSTQKAEVGSFWKPKVSQHNFKTIEESEEAIIEKLEHSVSAHLVSDVPVGIFLSGGVDSSLIASFASRHNQIEAFNIGTKSEFDETPYALKVAQHLNLKLHTRYVDASEFLNRFEDWCYYNDDPVSDPSALTLMVLAESARSLGFKVMLAGEGGDELFCGYNAYLRYAAFCHLSTIPFLPRLAKLWMNHASMRNADYLRTLDDPHFMGTAHVTSYRMRTELFHPEMRSVVEDFEKTAFEKRQEHIGRIRSAAMFDQSMRLPNDLLSRTDRATMALSLEARVPFLDHHLVELSNSLPDEWCLDLMHCRGKKILKRVAARFLPHEVIYRAKRGFDLPLEQWLTEKFGQVIREYLEEKLIPPLNYDYLAAICARPFPKELTAFVWSWLVLEHWYRLWILGKASPIEPKIVSNRQAYDLLRESGARERV